MKIWADKVSETPLLDIDVDDDSYRFRELRGDDSLMLMFSLPEYVSINEGAWCEFEREEYTVEDPSDVTIRHRRHYEYKVTLKSQFERAKRRKLRHPVDFRLKFSMTAKPVEHLQMIVENLNRIDSGWSVGECIDSSEKTINYNHSYCSEALDMLADECDTEWEIVRKVVSLHKVEYNKEAPLELDYGEGRGLLPGVVRRCDDDFPVDILYVQGGDRNIDPSSYGSKELLLPKQQHLNYDGNKFSYEEGFDQSKARLYISSSDGLSVQRSIVRPMGALLNDDSIDCSDIYPSRIGEVTSVVTVNEEKNLYDIVDSTIPDELDYSKCLIEGEEMTIVFQSGMLAGREFDAKYIHAPIAGKNGRRFEIVPQQIDGQWMPGGVYLPAKGDEYAVFGISLPKSYICNDDDRSGASWDMFREAVKNLYEKEDRKYVVKGELNGIWAKKNWLVIGGKIKIGGYVSFTNTVIQKEPMLMRITAIKQYVNDPHSPEITIANGLTAGSTFHGMSDRIDRNEVIIDEVRRSSQQYTKRRFRDAQETLSAISDAMTNFGDSINPATVQTMMLLVGDPSLQFRFVKAKGDPTYTPHLEYWDKESGIFISESGVIQHLTLGIESISDAHPASSYRYWKMERYESPVLDDPSKRYYLYASVSKAGDTGNFFMSENPEAFDGEFTYTLLVGILNSEYIGERSYVSLYGFTEILPGQITTDLIKDSQDRLIINLRDGTVTGPVTFTRGSSGLENLDEWQDKQNEINRANSNADAALDAANAVTEAVVDLENTINGSFKDGIITEAEAKAIEKYVNLVNESFGDLEAAYNEIYANPYLVDEVTKNGLKTAFAELSEKKDALISAINTAIADGKTTVDEAKAVDTAFEAYNIAVAAFQTAAEATSKAIQTYLKGLSDEAYEAAYQAAKQAAEFGKRLDGWAADDVISPAEKESLRNLEKQIRAEYPQISDDAFYWKVMNVADPNYPKWEAYDTAYDNALEAFGIYTASEPENIPIDVEYECIQEYFDAKADLLTAIAEVSRARLDDINKTAEEITAKTKGFTLIDGGLIYSQILNLTEVAGNVSAGASGISKDTEGNPLPAFWAGGTYAEAKGDDAVYVVRHDGSAKFGQVHLDPLGRIVVYEDIPWDWVEANESVIITSESIPTLEEIAETNINKTVQNTAQTINITATTVDHRELINKVDVEYLGATIAVSTTIKAEYNIFSSQSKPTLTARLTLYLAKDGEPMYELGKVSVDSTDLGSVTPATLLIDNVTNKVPKGRYSLWMAYSATREGANTLDTLKVGIEASTMRYKYTFSSSQFIIGNGGFVLKASAFNFLRATYTGLTAKYASGFVDLPGVLMAGKYWFNTVGKTFEAWGAKAEGVSVSSTNTGQYQIKHNIGHTNYYVQLTPEAAGLIYLGGKGATYFYVYTRDKSGNAVGMSFSFAVFGDNK